VSRAAQRTDVAVAEGGVRVLQRKCDCGADAGRDGACTECARGRVQRYAAAGAPDPAALADAPRVVGDVVASAGRPLDGATRAAMEARLGHDFSRVRVHTDGEAARSARAVHARAYTVGDHVVFGAGRFAPSTSAGDWLLAHELTHTVQQRIGPVGSESAAESEADRAADAALTGGPVAVATPGGGALLRDAEPDPERDNIVKAAGRTKTDAKFRAFEIVWRLLTRYCPDYSSLISAVGYDEKERGVRVDVKKTKSAKGETQTAVVTVGRRFVDETSDDLLRARIHELRTSLWASGLVATSGGGLDGAIAVWKIIHDKFPKKGGRVAGTSYDENLPGIRTEFGSGSVKAAGITVSWGGPTIYVGKAFLAIPDEAEKAAKIGAELAEIDKWSVENYRISAEDLADEDITLRIRGLGTDKLREFRDKTGDAKVRDYVGSLVDTSTPAEGGLAPDAGGGLATAVDDVKVTVLPDKVGDTKGKSGVTAVDASQHIDYEFSNTTKLITKYVPGPKTVTVQTTYAAAGNADVRSGYGRGTTKRDESLGAKTLRVHEGSHGLDFLQFVKDNKFPVFSGRTKISVDQANLDIQAFGKRVKAYAKRAEDFSEKLTDCAGTTIDQYNAAQGSTDPRVCRP
jgi:hypothetical protein